MRTAIYPFLASIYLLVNRLADTSSGLLDAVLWFSRYTARADGAELVGFEIRLNSKLSPADSNGGPLSKCMRLDETESLMVMDIS